MTRLLWAAAGAIAATAALAACGGGGHQTASPAVPVTAATKAPVSVSVKIRVPLSAAAVSSRRAAFVSASTQSVTFTLAGATAPLVVIAIAASAPNCTPDAAGLVCTAVLPLAPGSQQLTVTAYDGPNGTGTALSTSTTVVSVAPEAANTFAFTLNGIPASASIAYVNVSASATPIPPGTPATVQIAILAQDADGNTIVGGVPYASGIALANSDASGVVTVSPTTIDAPTTFATLSYNGGSSVGATITPMVNNRAGSAITFAPKGLTLKPVIDIGRQTGFPLALAFGPSGSNRIWFANGIDAGYGDMTSGAVTVVAHGNFGTVALGPDRRVWFAEFLPPGHIQSSLGDSTTNYPAAAGNQYINATGGSDGAMWFGILGGALERVPVDPMAPATTVFGSGLDQPYLLASCGNPMFYADYGISAVGRLTLSGGTAIDDGEVALGGIQSPSGILCRSDGTVWAVATNPNTLYRIVPATPFANSSVLSWPMSVSIISQTRVTANPWFTLTPDGAIWVGSLERFSNLPGPNSTAAPTAQTYNTNGVSITSLIAASDGTLWYADGQHIGIAYYGIP